MKAGIKTSEFWLTLLGVMLANAVQFNVLPADFPHEELIGGLTNIILVVNYVIQRTKLKSNGGG
jgi:hypothetical protein